MWTLPEGPRHFHEAAVTRTERSSLPEPAGWSLFPLPFVFMHRSSHLLLRFLRALKKPTVTPPSRLPGGSDVYRVLSIDAYLELPEREQPTPVSVTGKGSLWTGKSHLAVLLNGSAVLGMVVHNCNFSS